MQRKQAKCRLVIGGQEETHVDVGKLGYPSVGYDGQSIWMCGHCQSYGTISQAFRGAADEENVGEAF